MLCSSSEKVKKCFTTISNLAVTTRISLNNIRADFFLKGIFLYNGTANSVFKVIGK